MRRENVAAALKYLQDKANLRQRFERATSLDPQEQDLADKYAEAYQGHHGIIPLDDYPDGFKVQKDAAAYANSLLTFVKGIRGDLPKDTDLQNIIDEIVGEISALVYKLERFR